MTVDQRDQLVPHAHGDHAEALGPLRRGGDHDDGVVPLDLIVRHLMTQRGLPLVPAWNVARQALVDDGITLYVRTPGRFARPVEAHERFELFRPPGRRIRGDLNSGYRNSSPPTGGLLDWLDEYLQAGMTASLEHARKICVHDADAVRLFAYGGTAAVLSLVATASSAEQERELRERIASHRPMHKRNGRWPDKAAMLREMLRQYDERMRVDGASQAVSEEKIGELWGLEINTVHSYLTEARKAAAVEPAGIIAAGHAARR